MASTTVDLDTCIVSGIASEDVPQAEQEAMVALLQLYRADGLDLVTSEVAKNEIAAVPQQFRSRHETDHLPPLEGRPFARAEWTDRGLTLTGVGGGRREDPLY